jgi:CO/xanthine dehydrogenase Mo-binding subunit
VTGIIVNGEPPDLPSAGAGETPLIAVAPAIANAVFAATGRRLRAFRCSRVPKRPGERVSALLRDLKEETNTVRRNVPCEDI